MVGGVGGGFETDPFSGAMVGVSASGGAGGLGGQGGEWVTFGNSSFDSGRRLYVCDGVGSRV